MSNDAERDPVVRRAIDELQKMPQADAAAIRRVVVAAAAARVTPADDEPTLGPPRRPFRLWTVAGIAVAAAIAGFALSTVWRDRPLESRTTVAAAVPQAVTPVVNNAASEAVPINRQFVFNDNRAHSVSLVGDFNGWDGQRARMTREPGSGVWSITLPVIPGRHIYGFLVNDSIFRLDPRAPKAHDRDFGADGSVIIVGKP